MPVRYLAGVVCIIAAVVTAGCDSVIDPSKNTVEELRGTLPVAGQSRHDFSVSKNGEFEVKITALSPNQDAILGMDYGPIQGDQCGVYQQNFFVQLNRVALNGIINSGRYCIRLYDSSRMLSQPENYTLRVSHP
jgi:hypothetical protein